jgi:hypothetical protein
LVRHAIADLHRQAFSQLSGNQNPYKRLQNFVDGFNAYTQAGESDCLLAVFNHHNTATEETSSQQQTIAAQFADWHAQLALVYEQSGAKPKKAAQEAHDLLADLYGALLVAKMHNQATLFAGAIKRIKKQLKQSEK